MFLKRLNMLHSIGTYTCGSANVGIWYSLGDEKFWNQEGYESTLCLNAYKYMMIYAMNKYCLEWSQKAELIIASS